MPFVARDAKGSIVALYAEQSDGASEEIPGDSPEVIEFLGAEDARSEIEEHLAASDLDLIRVIEDVIYVLIEKRIIMLTDLPKAAQEKLSRRRNLRGKLGDLGGLIASSEELMLP